MSRGSVPCLGGQGVHSCLHLVRSRRFVLILTSILSLALVRFYQRYQYHTSWAPYSRNSDERRINNGTLGFGAIYVLNLPERSDKRDAMQLAASLTGLQLTWVDGMKGDKMNPKAVPPVHNDLENPRLQDGELGCWRGHMNIIGDIVKRSLSSALILEDDADWDIHIVQQLQHFAVATREVLASRPYRSPQGRSTYSMPDSPYGTNWDLLWVGHCGGWPPNPRFHQYHSVIRNDNTMPPASGIVDLTAGLDESQNICSAHSGRDPVGRTCDSPRVAPDERIVQYKGSPICTTGYAISQQGARKMLARLTGGSLIDVVAALDTEMTELCRGDKDRGDFDEMRCLSVSPPYISSHRPRGLISGESDINERPGNRFRVIGESQGLMWSTRMNVNNLIVGLGPEPQYIEDGQTGQWRYKTAADYGLTAM